MIRLGIHRALSRGTGFGMNSFRRSTPILMVSIKFLYIRNNFFPTQFRCARFPDSHTRSLTRSGKQRRDTYNKSTESTSLSSSDDPSRAETKPQKKPVNPATARWTSVVDPRPRPLVDHRMYQDVRDRGPLFNLDKIELDPDPEHAKKQWRHLCVEQQEKQKIAYQLWEANKELRLRCYCAETENIRIKEALADKTREYKILEADKKWIWELWKAAVAKNEATREALYEASQARKRLAMDNQRLAAEVQRLQRDIIMKDRQLAAPARKHGDAKDAARERESRADLRDVVFLLIQVFAACIIFTAAFFIFCRLYDI